MIHNPSYPCSCYVKWTGNAYSIEYCQLHKDAPRLLELINRTIAVLTEGKTVNGKAAIACNILSESTKTTQ